MTKKKYRVLHAPTSVGGNPQGLSRALNMLGVSSVNWIYRQNLFAYKVDRVLWQSDDGLIHREFERLVAIAISISSYDIVHYNSGSTLAGACPPPPQASSNLLIRGLRWIQVWYLRMLTKLELGILRLLRKPVFVHFQGDDARQGDYLRSHYEKSVADRVAADYYYAASDQFKRWMIRQLDRACDQIYVLNPDLMRVLPARAKFQTYGHVFLDEWLPVYNQLEAQRPLRIGHAPSNRVVKGTDLILKALDALRVEGFQFEFVLVEGMSQSEAKKCYEFVDVLVDQLFYGWYGGLAVEAMALGKPVIVYLRDEDLEFIPGRMRDELPFIRATSDTIKDVLRNVLTMPRGELLRIAQRSRAFVESWHDPVKIAAEIKRDYEEALRKRGWR